MVSGSARLVLAATGVHPERIRRLLVDHGPQRAVELLATGRLRASPRVREVTRTPAAEIRRRLAAIGVQPIWRGRPGYPAALEGIEDPPDVLFVRGSVPPAPAVAIVGTRRSTAYGGTLARAMGAAVADAGWVTVSGLARGIDVAAHLGTLDAAGAGIAVLGSGPDVWYPPEHREPGMALTERGAVITEYPPGTPPEPWRFPVRNRIISGLAEAVVVVEAAETGGALITARTALEQGRDVFAVPGDVDRPSSVGCNLLIRDGAHPVLGTDDLIEGLTLAMGRPPRSPVSVGGAPLLELLGDVGRTADDLAGALGTPIAGVLADLAKLEASGTVRRSGDRFVWARRRGAARNVLDWPE